MAGYISRLQNLIYNNKKSRKNKNTGGNVHLRISVQLSDIEPVKFFVDIDLTFISSFLLFFHGDDNNINVKYIILVEHRSVIVVCNDGTLATISATDYYVRLYT